MKIDIAELSITKVSIPDWKNKKEMVMKLTKPEYFLQQDDHTFSDFHYTVERRKHTGLHPYTHKFFEILDFQPHVYFGGHEDDYTCSDLWCMNYGTGGKIHVHDHHFGMSGILFAKFDPVFQESTTFISPVRTIWDHRPTNITPDVEEGDLLLFPSQLLHYTQPNSSDDNRIVFSFNIRPTGYVG